MFDNKDNTNEDNNLHPEFDFSSFKINEEDLKADAEKQQKAFEPVDHNDILKLLLDQIQPVNFPEYLGIAQEVLEEKLYIVASIEKILETAKNNAWALCKKNNSIYVYNSAYWKLLDRDELKAFLGKAAEKMGVFKYDARFYKFRDSLYKQFMAFAHLTNPEPRKNTTFINLQNGTFEITPERQILRPPKPADFLTYQLQFDFASEAKAPKFFQYLNQVLPDIKMQQILSEYIGYIFTTGSVLKLEKTLLLYGPGANGKSVFFEVINSLLGPENISNFSLQNLTDSNGYYRAMLGNKLLNYASEINGNLEASTFKQLVSGEPIEARLPYCPPIILREYAKLMFNCNLLPKAAEQTFAFFRRFLIIPFNVKIPEDQQDTQLAQKIIDSELPGIFNWVLEGLHRLLLQKNFTESEAVNEQLHSYKVESDSVQLFLLEEGYIKSVEARLPLKELYQKYKSFCIESSYHPCSSRTMSERLKNAGFKVERISLYNVVYITKESKF